MKKFLKRLAVLSLIIGGFSLAFAEEPTVELSPVGGSLITVRPGTTFYFTIIFTHTDVLTVYANDQYQNEVVPIPDNKRNIATQSSVVYGDVIPDYGVTKDYIVTVISLTGDEASDTISYETPIK